MAMGTRKTETNALFLCAKELPRAPTVPYYERLDARLREIGFDEYVEAACRPCYADTLGRPSLAPGVYFRALLLGYLLGIDSERRIALQARDSLSIRKFLGLALQDSTPDHSTLSRTRRRIPTETHEKVFTWVLGQLCEAGLADGRAKARAVLLTLRRNVTNDSYRAFLRGLAEAQVKPVGRIAVAKRC